MLWGVFCKMYFAFAIMYLALHDGDIFAIYRTACLFHSLFASWLKVKVTHHTLHRGHMYQPNVPTNVTFGQPRKPVYSILISEFHWHGNIIVVNTPLCTIKRCNCTTPLAQGLESDSRDISIFTLTRLQLHLSLCGSVHWDVPPVHRQNIPDKNTESLLRFNRTA